MEKSLPLPSVVEMILSDHPGLVPVLAVFNRRDSPTFVHSLMVTEMFGRLAVRMAEWRGWGLQQLRGVEAFTPFVLLHDVGKTAVDHDGQTALTIVHGRSAMERTNWERALHWLHPLLGAYVVRELGERNVIDPLRARWWAQAICFHHLDGFDHFVFDARGGSVSALEAARFKESLFRGYLGMSLLLFTLSDVAVAMGQPRPSRSDRLRFTDEVIGKELFWRLDERLLTGFSSGDGHGWVRAGLVNLTLEALRAVQQAYPPEVCLKGGAFCFREYALEPLPVAVEWFEELMATVWRVHERELFWGVGRIMRSDGFNESQ